MNPTIFLALASIYFAAVLTPGANFLLVAQNALAYSRRTGLLTVAGVATGASLYVTAGVIGFAAVVSQSALVYNLIWMIGAAYFAYMGYQLLTRQSRLSAEGQATAVDLDLSRAQAYRSGLMTAVANPASALYFLSLFTTFIPVSSTPVDKILAGLMLVSISLTCYACVALTFLNRRVRGLYGRAEVTMNRVFGIVWLLLAARLVLS